MKNKQKLILLIDVLIIILAIITLRFNNAVPSIMAVLKQSKVTAESEDLGFNFIPSPKETRAKAGETVTINIDVADIKIGENGLNSIVGFLQYDEILFETMEIESTENWNIELNQNQNHPLYGKFCIYTMNEGIKENQQIAEMTLKLKQNLKPQTTEIKFNDIVSSDGNIGVSEQDGKVWQWGKTSATPICLSDDNSSELYNVEIVDFKAINNEVFALGNNGKMYVWGENSSGYLGTGTKSTSDTSYQLEPT